MGCAFARERGRHHLAETNTTRRDSNSTETLYRAALVATGYRQHKRGEWRKSRSHKTKKDEGGELLPARRNELVDRLRGVVEKAQDGDEEALSKVKEIFKEAPSMARIFADLAGEAERSLVKRLTGGDPVVREALPVRLEAMRKALTGADPSILERLLAERIVACWLQVQYAEIIYAQNLGSMNITQSEYHQRRLDKLHRRYLSAIKELGQIRNLGPAVQINIAEQQINSAS
jgi:hypothetical protein